MIIVINKKQILEEYLKENEEDRGKKLTVKIYDNSYSIMNGKQILKVVQATNNNVFKEMGNIYGYCRISRKQQSIERQIRNVKAAYPTAFIYQEAFTGTKMDRPEWVKLMDRVKEGDTIVFDSVSRMSRDSDEGVKTYLELFDKGVNLVFLKEPIINTDVYAESLKDKLELTGTDEDEIFKGLNNYFRKLAKKQVKIAFDQAEKEVQDLRQRTREGIETARRNGKHIGAYEGKALKRKNEDEKKKQIVKYSSDFEGQLSDLDAMKLVRLSRNTYYKYKKEIKASLLNENTIKGQTSVYDIKM